MSVFGDAIAALRQVVLIQSRLDQLDQRISRMGDDVGGLADATLALRDRISRLEGVIEGAAMAAAGAAANRQRRIAE
ncbi:hypothetical protein [Sphingomonas abaci]|uniref:Uncharacterized protein n=1 Tax=Sphingomonas abaci TaxID=237611 RepID=A0A7W7EWT5_9SPHN|nr:hypothetical protein [Sphingomonas abaci]MBB4616411.1 hypothetical protein [Sphingomonas abaci]